MLTDLSTGKCRSQKNQLILFFLCELGPFFPKDPAPRQKTVFLKLYQIENYELFQSKKSFESWEFSENESDNFTKKEEDDGDSESESSDTDEEEPPEDLKYGRGA